MNPLEQMLMELESHQLRVCLVPLNPSKRGFNEGGCKLVLIDQNPLWYRRFCARHPSSRGIRRGGFDTRIKRANTLRSLARMLAGHAAGKYETELRTIASKIPAA